MIRFFIDGSNKGLVIGAGIVQVNDNGFMEVYDKSTMHPLANSYFAEMFALNVTLDKAIASNSNVIKIYVDTFHIENIFAHILKDNTVFFKNSVRGETEEYRKFANDTRNKLELFYKQKGNLSNITIQKLDETLEKREDYTVYSNTAHYLSRNYFNKYDSIYLDEDSSLMKSGVTAKLELNALSKTNSGEELFANKESDLVEARIDRDGNYWHSYLSDEETPYVSSKHLVNIFVHTHNNLCKELGVKDINFKFQSRINLVGNIEQSVNYKNCPQDIKEKGFWILEKVDKGDFQIN